MVAVEPLDEMREHLGASPRSSGRCLERRRRSRSRTGASTRSSVAQAFHWFDPERALPEIHRVLRSGGGIALLYNSRDLDDRVQKTLDDLLDPYRGEVARHWVKAHEEVLATSELFGPVEERGWRSEQPVSLDGLLEMAASRSYVASLEDGPRAGAARSHPFRVRGRARSDRPPLPGGRLRGRPRLMIPAGR